MPPKILIIDDEPDMLVLLRKIIAERTPYEVVTTPNPLELEKILEAQPIDLVITDWRMPGRDGLEVLAAVRRLNPALPVILITAYGNAETAATAREQGAWEYLDKPFHRDRLLEVIRKGLEAKGGP